MNCFPVGGNNQSMDNVPRVPYDGSHSHNSKGHMSLSSVDMLGVSQVANTNNIPLVFNSPTSAMDSHSSGMHSYGGYTPHASMDMLSLTSQQAYTIGVSERSMTSHPPVGVVTPHFHQPSDLYGNRHDRELMLNHSSPMGNNENSNEFRNLETLQGMMHPSTACDTMKPMNNETKTPPTPQSYSAGEITESSADRRRSERRKVPENMKDGKYLERRVKNNLAAKKSRDQRRQREIDQQLRASDLERENTVLRAQRDALMNEAESLRRMVFAKKGQHI